MAESNNTLTGEVLGEDARLSLAELSRLCRVHAEFIVELVEEGILDPEEPRARRWVFRGQCVRRVRTVVNLRRDLGVNLAGVAVALDLLDELESLRSELRRLER